MTRIGSSGRTTPLATTIAMMPAFRTSAPWSSRSSTAAIKPGRSPSSWRQGFGRPVTSITASAPQPQPGAGREPEEVETACRDVLAHLAGSYGKTPGSELFVQLGVDQVNLPEVGRGGVSCHAAAVAHGRTRVHVAFNAETGKQPDARSRRLREGVRATAVDGHHVAINHLCAQAGSIMSSSM